jgi:hypothetical protein
MTETATAGSMAYNPGVRIGNWFEDLCLEEDNLKGECHGQADHVKKTTLLINSN